MSPRAPAQLRARAVEARLHVDDGGRRAAGRAPPPATPRPRRAPPVAGSPRAAPAALLEHRLQRAAHPSGPGSGQAAPQPARRDLGLGHRDVPAPVEALRGAARITMNAAALSARTTRPCRRRRTKPFGLPASASCLSPSKRCSRRSPQGPHASSPSAAHVRQPWEPFGGACAAARPPRFRHAQPATNTFVDFR